MNTTRRRPRHNNQSRSFESHRGASVSVGCYGDVPVGTESVERRGDKFLAKVNPFGLCCSGYGATEEEALEKARSVAEELKVKYAA